MGFSISHSLTRDEINHINSFPLRWNDLGGFSRLWLLGPKEIQIRQFRHSPLRLLFRGLSYVLEFEIFFKLFCLYKLAPILRNAFKNFWSWHWKVRPSSLLQKFLSHFLHFAFPCKFYKHFSIYTHTHIFISFELNRYITMKILDMFIILHMYIINICLHQCNLLIFLIIC